MSELKQCPFCGEMGAPSLRYAEYEGNHRMAYVECLECYCRGEEIPRLKGYTDSIPRDKWNTRPIEDELRATIAKMNQDSLHSLLAKLSMLEGLEELDGLRKKLKIAVGALESVSEILGGPRSENVTLFEYSKMIEDALAKIKGD